MSFSTAQLQAIDDAIASGELKVSFNGTEVVYRSVDDLIKARNTIRDSLEQSGSLTKRKRTSFITRRMD